MHAESRALLTHNLPNMSGVESRREEVRTLRRWTRVAVGAGVAVNVLLFFQAGIASAGGGDVQGALISMVQSLFPGGGLRPAANPPTPASGASPVAVTGGS